MCAVLMPKKLGVDKNVSVLFDILNPCNLLKEFALLCTYNHENRHIMPALLTCDQVH